MPAGTVARRVTAEGRPAADRVDQHLRRRPDQAEQLCSQVLGFQVRTSAPYNDTERWLSMVSLAYGGIDAVFTDTCGNLLNHQD